MGCASSTTGSGGGLPGNPSVREKSADSSSRTATSDVDSEPSSTYPPAEAFEIALDDVDNDNDDKSDSLIKRHPPKRLQKLVEQAATAAPPTTIEHLEEKLAKAEVRRQQYIQQRIETITLAAKGAGNGEGNDQTDDGQNDEPNTDDGGGNAGDDGEAVVESTSHADAKDVANAVQPLNERTTSANEHIQNDGHPNTDNLTSS